ncbi:MAG TPA: hypothetical protein VF195_02970 [Actinomycetota bacterium]
MRTDAEGPRGPVRHDLLALTVVATLVGACTPSPEATPSTVTPPATSPSANAPATIPQPSVHGDLPLAPEGERVDTAMPTFSDPTNITNPLFPVSRQASAVLLGHVDDQPFRTEVTLLPETRIIGWQGRLIEVAVSQYNAFLGGRIAEVAYDLYAQADDGSVWYFGEDVFDFRDGAIVVTEGTWLAGKDGPAAMIMPADLQVGDVYRPENAPGIVFEEVTVASVREALDGPLGPIQGGMLASELHMDGGTEDKLFAPGYGEFSTSGGGDVEALALAVPTDTAIGSMPRELTAMSEGALSAFAAAGSGSWKVATTAASDVVSAWKTYRSEDVPSLIEPLLETAVDTLDAAVDARSPARARNAAIDAARLSFDLQLRYRPVTEIDLARMDLWAAQLLVDEAAGHFEGVAADAFAMDYVRDRIRGALDGADLARVNTALGEIQVAVVDEEPAAAAEAAGRLRDILAGLEPAG